MFNPYIKIRHNKKVNNRRQVNNSIFKVIKIYLNHLIIKNIVIKNETRLIKHNKLQKRLFKSYIKYKRSEKWYKNFKELEFNRLLIKINRIIILLIKDYYMF